MYQTSRLENADAFDMEDAASTETLSTADVPLMVIMKEDDQAGG